MMALKLPLLRQLAAVAIPLQPDRPSASATASAWRGQRIGAHSPADARPPRVCAANSETGCQARTALFHTSRYM